MKNRHIRSIPFALGVAALISLGAAPLVCGAETEVKPGTWVRVKTGGDTATPGRSLSHDGNSTTFEVNGQPVRVARPGKTLEGSVRRVDANELVLGGPDEKNPIVIPRNNIVTLDVRRRASKKALGIVVGIFGGGLIGYGIGSAASGPGCQGGETGFAHLCALDDTSKAGGAVLGIAAGALIGGLAAPGAKWEKDYPLDRIQVSVGPVRGRGIGLGLSLAF